MGDNFLNKGYSDNAGYDFAWQVNPTRHLFFGVMSRTGNEQVSNSELIGDFNSAKSGSSYFYFGYRHFLKNSKMYLEHYIGSGNKEITNKSGLSSYSINSTNSYVIGSRFNYQIVPEFAFFAGIDFAHTTYSIDLSEPYKDFYSKSSQITPTLGIKFSFWTVGKNKKPTSEMVK